MFAQLLDRIGDPRKIHRAFISLSMAEFKR